jgi:hypothetical protein
VALGDAFSSRVALKIQRQQAEKIHQDRRQDFEKTKTTHGDYQSVTLAQKARIEESQSRLRELDKALEANDNLYLKEGNLLLDMLVSKVNAGLPDIISKSSTNNNASLHDYLYRLY